MPRSLRLIALLLPLGLAVCLSCTPWRPAGKSPLAPARMSPDAMVLDVMLPDVDGLEVCRQLRATSSTPILFLSARSDEVDRIVEHFASAVDSDGVDSDRCSGGFRDVGPLDEGRCAGGGGRVFIGLDDGDGQGDACDLPPIDQDLFNGGVVYELDPMLFGDCRQRLDHAGHATHWKPDTAGQFGVLFPLDGLRFLEVNGIREPGTEGIGVSRAIALRLILGIQF